MSLIYKFLPADIALKVIETQQLRVSLLHQVNDIYDCQPRIIPSVNDPSQTEDEWTDFVSKTNQEGFGLLCFADTYKSPLLWGHYASCSTGLALGFDPNCLKWDSKMEVDYKQERPKVQWPGENVNITPEDLEIITRGCFGVKSKEWEYEKEVRYIVPLRDCLPTGGMYFVNYEIAALKQVLIGNRSSISPHYLNNLIRYHFPNSSIEIRPAKLHASLYEIVI